MEKKYEKGMLRPDGQLGFPTPTGRIEFWCDALARSATTRCPTTPSRLESPISQPELAEEYPLIVVTGTACTRSSTRRGRTSRPSASCTRTPSS
ncbi:MAG: hypothetical protein V8S24_02520 [Gordonibacter pamelaeae]